MRFVSDVLMSCEVSILRDFGRETALRKKWLKMWETLGLRILKLPKWMQEIVLEDVNTAVKNRLATMEMIYNARKGGRVA
jgi:hypothetical protein